MVGTNPPAPGDAADSAGVRATDVAAAVDGAISPCGGPKGYASGLMIEMLVATLTPTALGDAVRGTLDPTDLPAQGDAVPVSQVTRTSAQQITADVPERH
jgi:LDH2 family malate/lactate/ureidoglycolate dehydrogenase